METEDKGTASLREFIHLFNKYLLNTYYALENVLVIFNEKYIDKQKRQKSLFWCGPDYREIKLTVNDREISKLFIGRKVTDVVGRKMWSKARRIGSAG